MTGDNRQLIQNSDAFNNLTNPRTNVLDVAAHYPYSPERWTFRVNGTRQLLQYGSVSQYNHAGDVHELKPAAGETVTLETAERPRYVVQYELASTFAFSINQDLQEGDRLRIGLYDGSDGWYMEQTGSHDPLKADFVMEREGTEKYRETHNIFRPTTEFSRLKLQTGWYNITRQRWERSYVVDDAQKNTEIAKTSGTAGEGPITGNLPLHFEVEASADTTNLVMNAGSCAQVNLGQTTRLIRSKLDVQTDTVDTTGSWTPLRAYRIDPERGIVNVQVNALEAGKYTGNGDVELVGIAFDKSNVKDGAGDALVDSDFSVPAEFNPRNNVIESTNAVEQIADNTGTLQTSVTNPGGFQLGRSELYSSSGRTATAQTPLQGNVKRPLYERDYLVILGRTSATGDVSYQVQFEQDF